MLYDILQFLSKAYFNPHNLSVTLYILLYTCHTFLLVYLLRFMLHYLQSKPSFVSQTQDISLKF